MTAHLTPSPDAAELRERAITAGHWLADTCYLDDFSQLSEGDIAAIADHLRMPVDRVLAGKSFGEIIRAARLKALAAEDSRLSILPHPDAPGDWWVAHGLKPGAPGRSVDDFEHGVAVRQSDLEK